MTRTYYIAPECRVVAFDFEAPVCASMELPSVSEEEQLLDWGDISWIF